MLRKMYCSFLVGFSLFSSTTSTQSNLAFSITANSNSENDIKIMYEYKNNIVNDYSKMIVATNQSQVIEDLLILHPELSYNHGKLVCNLGESKGKTISGELRDNYCNVEVKPKSFFAELFKK